MKYMAGLLCFVLIISCKEQAKEVKGDFSDGQVIQLNSPTANIDSPFFKNNTTVQFSFAYPDAQIRYTTDGSDVTENSNLYDKPIPITTSTQIKARSFHSDFKPSDEVTIQFKKIKNDISKAKITVDPKPNTNYAGMGITSLTDLQKGSLQVRQGKKWLGFDKTEVVFKVQLPKKKELSNIILSSLVAQSSWIFSPHTVSVFSGTEQVGQFSNKQANKKTETAMSFIEIPIKKQSYDSFKIVVHNQEKIPDWHSNKGEKPWFFIDELIIE